MPHTFDAVKLTDRVYWVGAVDWTVRDFHGYRTSRGTTYNAYLVADGGRYVLVDTVKAPFLDEMMARIGSVVEPSAIDTIVSNHAELDHSGALPAAIAALKPKAVVASAMGVKALQKYYGGDLPVEPVTDGGTLTVGGLTLRFIETRMVHWPDSMFTLIDEEKLLFSQDGFGMHLASSERFADQLGTALLDEEAATYYANILLPLSPIVGKLLGKVAKAGLSFDIVAPDHGPIWRTPESIGRIVGQYERWSAQRLAPKAVVLYGTMWRSTALMAKAIVEGLAAEGVAAHLFEAGPDHRTAVAAAMLDAAALVAGSSTLNNNMLPCMADMLTYLKGLKPAGRIGAAFGSYGWSGEGVAQVASAIEAMKMAPVSEPVKVQYAPTDAELRACRELGREVGRRVNALCAKADAAPQKA